MPEKVLKRDFKWRRCGKLITALLLGGGRWWRLSFVVFACLAWASCCAAASFTSNRLVISRVGGGTSALTSAATPLTLVEFNLDGSQTGTQLELPAVAGANGGGLTDSGISVSNGHLQRSIDLKRLILTGYDAPIGTLGVIATSAAAVNRVVLAVNGAGDIERLANLSGAFSGGNIRSATLAPGGACYIAGTTGVGFVDVKSPPAVASNSVLVDVSTRLVSATRDRTGNVFLVACTGSELEVFNGLPAQAAAASSLGISPVDAHGFVCLDRSPSIGAPNLGGIDTIYVADGVDTKSSASGILRKFEWDGVSWKASGAATIANPSSKLFGLTARETKDGAVELFATTAVAANNCLVTIRDVSNGNAFGGFLGGTLSVVAKSGKDYAFRGVSFTPAADLAVSVAGPSEALAGSPFLYTVNARNLGETKTENVSVSLALPSGVTFQSVESPEFNAQILGGTVVLSGGTIQSGGTLSVGVKVVAGVAGPVLLPIGAVSVSTTDGVEDFQTGNNLSPTEVVTSVTESVDLAVSVAAPDQVLAGQEMEYQIRAQNIGLSTANGVGLRLRLPGGLVYREGQGDGFSTTVTGGSVVFSNGSLLGGSQAILSVKAHAVADGTYVLTGDDVQIYSEALIADANETNNRLSASISTQVRTCDLTVSASARAPFIAGAPNASYEVQVSNVGSGATHGRVHVSVSVPDSAKLISLKGVGWNTAVGPSQTLTVSREDSLSAGSVYSPIEAIVALESSASEVMASTFTVSGGDDFVPENNTRSLEVTVLPSAPGILEFASVASEVFEEAGVARVEIRRVNGWTGVVSARLKTINGTALAGIDYDGLDRAVEFANGEVSKVIEVSVTRDKRVEANESFTLALSEPEGGASLGVASHVVTVLEPDQVMPDLTIVSPSSGASVPEGPVMVRGRAGDDKAIRKVEVSLNDGPFVSASHTADPKASTNYFLSVNPNPGPNTLVVKATDTRGNQRVVSRAFHYVVKRPLSLTLAPAQGGTVALSPQTMLSQMEVGAVYRLSAVPRSGYVWNGWFGEGIAGAMAENATLSVQMKEGLAIRADFIPNPFVENILGDYEGIVTARQPASHTPETSGMFSLKVNAGGSFSGVLVLANERYPVTGVFDNSGQARFGSDRLRELRLDRLNRPSLGLSLVLEFSATPTIRGVVGEYLRAGLISKAEVQLERIYFDGSSAAHSMSAATYNFAIPSRPQTNGLNRGDFPRGAGIGTLTVDARGQGILQGTLADGSVLSARLRFRKDKSAILYAPLYNGGGQILGILRIDEAAADSDLYAADVWWFKPQLNDSYYPLGWPEGLSLEMVGTRFRKPALGSVFPDLSMVSESNAVLSLMHGGLTSAVQKQVFISERDVVRRVPEADTTFSLTVNHETGRVSGDFTAMENAKTGFSGIILNKGANRKALGFFLSPRGATLEGGGKSGFVQLSTRATGSPSLVISEFMSKNKSAVSDDDGDYSDWIELYNPKGSALDLNGWYLTDDLQNPTKWKLPALSLGAGQFMVVWASGKNRRDPAKPLHTNFTLSSTGEYLAVVRPDGVTVEQQFDGSVAGLSSDESYGLDFSGIPLVATGASNRVRVGPIVPADAWNLPGFNDSSWQSAKFPLGYGLEAPGFALRQVAPSTGFGGVFTLSQAKALLAYPLGASEIATETTVVSPDLNFLGDGGDGHYTGNRALPILNLEQYVLSAKGRIIIPEDDLYTFGLNSDDGGTILIDGEAVMVDDSNHGAEDHLGVPIRLSAGAHSVEVVMWEGGGGDCLEFFAARGAHTKWNEEFHLVGSAEGLPVRHVLSKKLDNSLPITDLETTMKAVSSSIYVRAPFRITAVEKLTSLSLRVAYNDGFVAYLNGVEVARRNAPSLLDAKVTATEARDLDETKTFENIELSPFVDRLRNGDNVLAFVGLNVSANDASFYLEPTLTANRGLSGKVLLYSPTQSGSAASPGDMNPEKASSGKVGPSSFSVRRGIYREPFDLVIRNPLAGVSIRYTVDGSTPTKTHGTLITGPLRISKTCVLRTFAYRDGFVSGASETQTYLFLDDVIRQSANGKAPGPGWPTQPVNDQVFDYGMDSKIVNHTSPRVGGPAVVKAALEAIPSISIVTDLENLFDPQDGIWVNAGARGRQTEKPASVELINDDADSRGGFQINCGIRLRGGFSRWAGNPKHALKLYFRDSYGGGVLKYPIVGPEGAESFEEINLRTSQNHSWSLEGSENNTFLREETARDLQGAMGHPHSRARNFHLYLNGQYWGVYNTDERPEASFAAAYMGGNKEDYDVVKADQDNDYSTGVTDGNLDAWSQLFAKTKAHALNPSNANYFALQGRASDGVTPSADPVLLDIDNFIDYLLLTFWSGNTDGCTSAFLGEVHANNWSGIRDRTGKTGFRFFVHDFEHSMFNIYENRTGPFSDENGVNLWAGADSNYTKLAYSNPMFMHHDLLPNAEYRMRWADRAQKHLFGGGALTAAKVSAVVRRRAAIVESAIVAESARWGDANANPPRTREDWLRARDFLLNEYIPQRGNIVLGQLREDGLYPSLSAPTVNHAEKILSRGTELVLEAAGVPVLYTLDGSDPRLVGGSINSVSRSYIGSSTTEVLISKQSEWSFLADGSNQGTVWREPVFDSSAWPSGSGEFGYGDGDEHTIVPFVDVDSQSPEIQKNATTYFRRSFELPSLSGASVAKLWVKYDDAVIVYLNGVEVARSPNIESGVSFDAYSNGAAPDESEYYEFAVPLTALREGANVIAAEVHQAAANSSDISFDLMLELTRISTQTPLILADAGVVVLKARAFRDGEWSALLKQEYDVRDFPNLRVTPVVLRDGVVGGEGTLEIHVSNEGALASRGTISLEAQLPIGVSAVSFSGTSWVIVRGTGSSILARYEGVLSPRESLPVLSLRVAIAETAARTVAPDFKVSGGGDPTGGDNTGAVELPVTRNDKGRVSFELARIVAFEEDRRVSFKIVRKGNSAGVASVRVRTTPGSARLNSDFYDGDQVVEFADGETIKEVGVEIVADALSEPNETFTVSLFEASEGTVLGTPAEATVVISATDSTPPKVVLEKPAAGARVVSAGVSIGGIVTDDLGVASVEVKVNKGEYQSVPFTVNGDGRNVRFDFGIDAKTGANAVEVRGFDYRGNESLHVIRSFTYVPLRPLKTAIQPSQSGTLRLSPAGNVELLEVGKWYSLTAVPNTGKVFSGWTVSGTSVPSLYANPLSILMDKGISIAANFVENPFQSRVPGEYTGWVHSVEMVSPENTNHGLIRLNVSSSGTFTGKLLVDNEMLSFTGVFGPDGVGRFGSQGDEHYRFERLLRKTLVLSLHIDLGAGGLGLVTGTLEQEHRSGLVPMSRFAAGRAYYDGKTAQTSARVRSISVGITTTHGLVGGASPANGGKGTVSVTRAGLGVFLGTLPDGTKVSASSALSRPLGAIAGDGDVFVLYSTLYSNGHGSIGGDIHAPDDEETTELAAALKWFRPYLSLGQYPQGWPEGIDLKVSRER